VRYALACDTGRWHAGVEPTLPAVGRGACTRPGRDGSEYYGPSLVVCGPVLNISRIVPPLGEPFGWLLASHSPSTPHSVNTPG
jgi:hypothetical protein